MLFEFGSQGANCWHQYNCSSNFLKWKIENSDGKFTLKEGTTGEGHVPSYALTKAPLISRIRIAKKLLERKKNLRVRGKALP